MTTKIKNKESLKLSKMEKNLIKNAFDSQFDDESFADSRHGAVEIVNPVVKNLKIKIKKSTSKLNKIKKSSLVLVLDTRIREALGEPVAPVEPVPVENGDVETQEIEPVVPVVPVKESKTKKTHDAFLSEDQKKEIEKIKNAFLNKSLKIKIKKSYENKIYTIGQLMASGAYCVKRKGVHDKIPNFVNPRGVMVRGYTASNEVAINEVVIRFNDCMSLMEKGVNTMFDFEY